MTLVVVSPHLDDAVLSVGQLLAHHPGAKVVTCLAGTPPMGDMLTSYDERCGFTSSEQAIECRRHEDGQAMQLLRAEAVHLPFLDRQYGQPTDAGKLADVLDEAIGLDPSLVIAPVGLVHPDHETVADAFGRVLVRRNKRAPLNAWLYEDLPSRVLWPEHVPERLAWWKTAGYGAELEDMERGPRALKEAAIDCYRSQLWALDRPTLLVPERYWRLVR